MRLGFVVASHAAPTQLLRLVRTISRLYGNPPIAIHHDFSRCDPGVDQFDKNVKFVADWCRTGWAQWSVNLGVLKALDLLYKMEDPDYFFLLSGSDYPTARPEKVYEDLSQSGADAFIDAYDLYSALNGSIGPHDPTFSNYRLPYNVSLAGRRYLQANVKIPVLRRARDVTVGWRLGGQTVPLPWGAIGSPFSCEYKCFVGSQWFTASRRAAKKLLSPSQQDMKLRRHLSGRMFSEECYFQTVFCNEDQLRKDLRSFRYMDWRPYSGHPRDIGPEHLDHIQNEKPHFTRKFKPGDPLLDVLDREIGVAC